MISGVDSLISTFCAFLSGVGVGLRVEAKESEIANDTCSIPYGVG